jgi:haloacetate dehalogenase
MPETLISADPDAYYFRGNRHLFHPDALAEYLKGCHDPKTVWAMCEDYRAATSYDYAVDLADQQSGRKITCPMFVLWGANGPVGQLYDVLAVWRDWADNVQGRALDCGHYLPEEQPDEVLAEFQRFFGIA